MQTEPKKTNEAEADERLPYEPPAVISEEVFETLALSCGKLSGNSCSHHGGGLSS
jgi:hypothetical protein